MPTCVIVGAGQAGAQCAASLRQNGYEGEILLIGAETEAPYERPPLSKGYLAGKTDREKLLLRGADFYAERDITLRTGVTVTQIDPDRKLITLDSSNQISFDQLVLATGTAARPLPVPGGDMAGVHLLRSLADVDGIRRDLDRAQNVIIIGGGYIGLEAAAVTAQLGLKPVIIEMQDRLLARTSAPEIAAFYKSLHEESGVDIKLGVGVSEVRGTDRVEQVILSDGSSLDADVIIAGIGVVPCTALAEQAGLTVDNGIVVDEFCRTSTADIWAIGDCTLHPSAHLGRSIRLESVPNAIGQGKTAAADICGSATPYDELPWFWSDQYDLRLQIAGIAEANHTNVLRGDPASKSFSVLWMDGDVMTACESVNRPKDFLQAKKLISGKVHLRVDELQDIEIPLKTLSADG